MSPPHHPTAHGQSHPKSTPSPPTTFEFTKRKRWADLLINELSEAIIFVLSCDAQVWFCGRAITELLGWRDADLIDRDFSDFINAEDKQAFHSAFQDSLRTRIEMNAYIRLRCRTGFTVQHVPHSQVLFELKGYPLYLDNEPSPRCFFAVAKPYPSRNVAMLNTFLELKIENERLQQRLAELRVRACSLTVSPPGHSVSTGYSHGSSRGIDPDMSGPYRHAVHHHHAKATRDDLAHSANQTHGTGYDGRAQYVPQSGPSQVEDDGDDTTRRKKMRKIHSTEQYVCVTCGRTDSPEWRKGPQGPKTLCNACGLRWAKEVRNKADETSAASGSGGCVVNPA